jgi:hypothetical protein
MSQEDTLRELRKISKILILTNSAAVEKELAKIASTKERKQMWVYTDGKRVPKEIAQAVKVTPQAVSLFLLAGVALDLIEYERGNAPRRILDYVPPEWLSLVEISAETEEGSEKSTQAKTQLVVEDKTQATLP